VLDKTSSTHSNAYDFRKNRNIKHKELFLFEERKQNKIQDRTTIIKQEKLPTATKSDPSSDWTTGIQCWCTARNRRNAMFAAKGT